MVPVAADTHTGCLVLFQQGKVDAITGDDTVLAGLVAQDPYAKVTRAPAFSDEPYGLGMPKNDPDFVRFVNGVLERCEGGRPLEGGVRPLAGRGARPSARPAADRSTGGKDDCHHDHGGRHRPRRAGWVAALPAAELLRYLDALGAWRDQRKAELDELDAAALEAPDADALTDDVLLSMALWKAVADRHDLLLATWDSGRVGTAERERMSH